MYVTLTAIGLLVNVLDVTLIYFISRHRLEDTSLYKPLYTCVTEFPLICVISLKATKFPATDKFYLNMIFYVCHVLHDNEALIDFFA